MHTRAITAPCSRIATSARSRDSSVRSPAPISAMTPLACVHMTAGSDARAKEKFCLFYGKARSGPTAHDTVGHAPTRARLAIAAARRARAERESGLLHRTGHLLGLRV